jgi:CrcB protein
MMIEFFALLTQNHPELEPAIAVSGGAVLGALSRYYITARLARWLGIGFPCGTFFINLSGCLLIGFFATLEHGRVILPPLSLSVLTGFLGSYTTFSTYALDSSNLLRSGARVKALIYWGGSAMLG